MNNPDWKELRVYIDPGFHRQFKVVAASLNLTIKEALIEAVGMWIRAKSKELGVSKK